jgi:hypothetical protein
MTAAVSSTNINYGQSVTITATITTSTKNPPITGTFRFGFETAVMVNGTPGTDATGNQTLTASATMTPQGNTVAQIDYGGDSNFEAAVADTSFITVNIPDFTLGPAGGFTVVATAGQPGSAQLMIGPATQTPSTVNLSFYPPNPVAGYTLSFSPQQVSLNGSATTATLSLTPLGSAPQATIRRSTRHSGFLVLSRRNGDWWSLGLVSGLAVLLLLGLPGRDRRYRIALGFSAACFLCFAIGCGGGSSGGGGAGGNSPTPTSTALTTSIAKVDQNTQFVLTMKVTGQHPLTGTVTIFDNGTAVLGGFSLINGEAQTTGGFGGIFQIGVHQLTATYGGDPENLASTSSAATQVITGTNQIFITGNTGAASHNISATVVIQ